MMELAIVACLILLLGMSTVASVGWEIEELKNRENWVWCGILCLEAVLMPNPWAAAILVSIIHGLFMIGRSWFVIRSLTIPIAGFAGIYALVAPRLELWMIEPILWLGFGLGYFLAIYGILGLLIEHRPFRLILCGPPVKPIENQKTIHLSTWAWPGAWLIYEDLPYQTQRFMLGQHNTMTAVAVASFALTCGAGLFWIDALPVYMLPVLLPILFPHAIILSTQKNWHPHSGHVALVGLVLGFLWLLEWRVAMGTAAAIATVVAVLIYRSGQWRTTDGSQWWLKPGGVWIDAGRLHYWADALALKWWPAGWKVRLFGGGVGTWFPLTFQLGEKRHFGILTAAHNEFIQQLVEHGLVGLVVLVGYLYVGLVHCYNGPPELQVVFLLIMTWIPIAPVNFPATFWHEFHPTNAKGFTYIGSPTLNAWTLIIALLAEAH